VTTAAGEEDAEEEGGMMNHDKFREIAIHEAGHAEDAMKNCLGRVVGLLAGAIAGGVARYGLVLVEEATRKTGPGQMYFGAELLLPFLIVGGGITGALFGFRIARKA
jgi:hypothetical protein